MLNETFSVIFKHSEFMIFGTLDNGKYFFSSSTLSLGHHEIAFKLLWYFHTWCQRFILMKIPLLKLCLMRRSLKGLCAKRFYSLVRGLVNIPGRHNSPTENIAEFWHFPPRARWEKQTRYTSCKKPSQSIYMLSIRIDTKKGLRFWYTGHFIVSFAFFNFAL